MKLIQNSQRGFSLIELMVVIAIIGILAATAIVNTGTNADRDVRQEKDRFTSFLREVENKALATDIENISFDGKRMCGFGFSANGINDASEIKAYYITSSDLNENCDSVSVTKSYSGGNVVDTFSFRNGVTVDGLFPDILFLTPNGTVYEGETVLVGKVDISLKKGVASDTVSIDDSGNIK